MSRDTQFAGSAMQLWKRIEEHIKWIDYAVGADGEDIQRLIANYSYDLACHVASETIGGTDVSHVPDLTTWTEGEQ